MVYKDESQCCDDVSGRSMTLITCMKIYYLVQYTFKLHKSRLFHNTQYYGPSVLVPHKHFTFILICTLFSIKFTL